MGGFEGWKCIACLGLVFLAHLGEPAVTRAQSAVSGSESRIKLRGAAGMAVRRAVQGARQRLMEPTCQRLLGEFRDGSGQPLQARLDAMGLSAADYLGFIFFVDGSSQAACQSGNVLGATQPGSRLVSICADFAETGPRLAEAVIIHETLHSLGLGENPPSSQEITTRVLRSCRGTREGTLGTSARGLPATEQGLEPSGTTLPPGTP